MTRTHNSFGLRLLKVNFKVHEASGNLRNQNSPQKALIIDKRKVLVTNNDVVTCKSALSAPVEGSPDG